MDWTDVWREQNAYLCVEALPAFACGIRSSTEQSTVYEHLEQYPIGVARDDGGDLAAVCFILSFR